MESYRNNPEIELNSTEFDNIYDVPDVLRIASTIKKTEKKTNKSCLWVKALVILVVLAVAATLLALYFTGSFTKTDRRDGQAIPEGTSPGRNIVPGTDTTSNRDIPKTDIKVIANRRDGEAKCKAPLMPLSIMNVDTQITGLYSTLQCGSKRISCVKDNVWRPESNFGLCSAPLSEFPGVSFQSFDQADLNERVKCGTDGGKPFYVCRRFNLDGLFIGGNAGTACRSYSESMYTTKFQVLVTSTRHIEIEYHPFNGTIPESALWAGYGNGEDKEKFYVARKSEGSNTYCGYVGDRSLQIYYVVGLEKKTAAAPFEILILKKFG